MPREIPITITVYGELTVNDPAVLDLSRGEAMYGQPFDDEDALLQHLGVNLIGAGHRLSSLDGWADLADDAVDVRVNDTEAEVEMQLARGDV